MLDLRTKEQKQASKLEAKIYHQYFKNRSVHQIANIITHQMTNPVVKLKNLMLAVQDGHGFNIIGFGFNLSVNGSHVDWSWLDTYKERRKQIIKVEIEKYCMNIALTLKEKGRTSYGQITNFILDEYLYDVDLFNIFVYGERRTFQEELSNWQYNSDNEEDKKANNNLSYLIDTVSDFISDLSNPESYISQYFAN